MCTMYANYDIQSAYYDVVYLQMLDVMQSFSVKYVKKLTNNS